MPSGARTRSTRRPSMARTTARLTVAAQPHAGGRAGSISAIRPSSQVQRGRSRSFAGKGEASGVAPKLLLGYRLAPAPAWPISQVSQGYRAGGFNTSGPAGQGFAGGLGEPARLYDPDKLWNYEAGLKAWLARRPPAAHGRLRVQVAQHSDRPVPAPRLALHPQCRRRRHAQPRTRGPAGGWPEENSTCGWPGLAADAELTGHPGRSRARDETVGCRHAQPRGPWSGLDRQTSRGPAGQARRLGRLYRPFHGDLRRPRAPCGWATT